MERLRLLLITDRHQCGARPLLDQVARALDGGLKAVQLREKDLDDDAYRALADPLRRLTADHSALLILNNRPHLVAPIGADGVHLGIDSQPPEAVRPLLPAGSLIGYSAHQLDEIDRLADAVDYFCFSPVFTTPSKLSYGAPQGIDQLREAVQRSSKPVIALGGIDQENLAAVLATGVHGAAVIRAILAAINPAEAVRELDHSCRQRLNHLL